jgi:hypothetical protein
MLNGKLDKITHHFESTIYWRNGIEPFGWIYNSISRISTDFIEMIVKMILQNKRQSFLMRNMCTVSAFT